MENISLQDISIFKCLSQEEMNDVRFLLSIIKYKRGDIIFEKGTRLKGVNFINKGVVKLHKDGAKGKDQIFHFLKKGDIFGYDATLNSHPTDVFATAIENVELYFVPTSVMFSLMEENVNFRIQILQAVCKELEIAQNLMIDISQKKHKDRLFELLISFKDKYGIDEDGMIDLALKRGDLASHVGACVEQTTRLISYLKGKKIIKTKGKKIGFM